MSYHLKPPYGGYGHKRIKTVHKFVVVESLIYPVNT